MTTFALNDLWRNDKLALKPLPQSGTKDACLNDAVGDLAMHAHLLEAYNVPGDWDAAFACDAPTISIDVVRFSTHAESDFFRLSLDGLDVVIGYTRALCLKRS